MAQHVGMRLDAKIGRDGGPLDHAGEAGCRQRRAAVAGVPLVALWCNLRPRVCDDAKASDALQSAEALLDWFIFARSIEPRMEPVKAGEIVKELIDDLPAAAQEEQVVETDMTKFTLLKLPTIGLSLTATARE
jgi:hypothetical protein